MKYLLTLLLLCLAAPVYATEWFCCPSSGTLSTATSGTLTTSPTGFGSWPGGSLATSCSNLQTSMNSCIAGDTLYVAGSYVANGATTLTTSNAGVAAKPISLIGCTTSGGTVGGARFSLSGTATTGYYAVTISQNYWRISNIAFALTGNANFSGCVLDSTHYTYYDNDTFSNPGTQMLYGINGAVNSTFLGCDFGPIKYGIGNGGTGLILNCTFHDCVGAALDGRSGDTAVNCYFYNNAADVLGTSFHSENLVGCTLASGTVSAVRKSIDTAGFEVGLYNCRITGGTATTAFTSSSGSGGIRAINDFVNVSQGTLNGIISDFAPIATGQATTITTTGTLGYTATASNNYGLLPTAQGYYTSVLCADGSNTCLASQGANASQNPASYSTSASLILSGSYAASGGTLGTWNASQLTLSTVASGTAYGPSSGSIGQFTGAGFNSIGGTTGIATEPLVKSGSTYMLLGVSLTGSNAGFITTIGGTPYNANLTLAGSTSFVTSGSGSLAGGAALTWSGSNIRYGSGTGYIGSTTLVPSAPVPGPLRDIPPERPWLKDANNDHGRVRIEENAK